MEFQEVFNKIQQYQKKLGYNHIYPSTKARMENIRAFLLALNQEVAELTDSFPWKPWRKTEDQIWDIVNATEEIIDCIFFLTLICGAAGISFEFLEERFLNKLKENYDRIEREYSNKPEERG